MYTTEAAIAHDYDMIPGAAMPAKVGNNIIDAVEAQRRARAFRDNTVYIQTIVGARHPQTQVGRAAGRRQATLMHTHFHRRRTRLDDRNQAGTRNLVKPLANTVQRGFDGGRVMRKVIIDRSSIRRLTLANLPSASHATWISTPT